MNDQEEYLQNLPRMCVSKTCSEWWERISYEQYAWALVERVASSGVCFDHFVLSATTQLDPTSSAHHTPPHCETLSGPCIKYPKQRIQFLQKMNTVIPNGFRALPLPLAQLSLAAVLKCGQSFRWCIFSLHELSPPSPELNIPTHEYRLCLRDRVVCLRQSSTSLFYRSVFPQTTNGDPEAREAETLAWIRDYFQLDVDLKELYAQWSAADPVFHRLQDRFEGIRMLRQDPFENLMS